MTGSRYTLPNSSGPNRSDLLAVAVLAVIAVVATLLSQTASAQAQGDAEWPRHQSEWFFEIVKDPNASPEPWEPWDRQWLHLHRNHPMVPDAPVNVIAPRIYRFYGELAPPLDLEVRYFVRGVPVSDWVGAPYRFELWIDNEGLSQLPDGVHDLTIEARGPDRDLVQTVPAFVHITRDLANGQPFGFDRTVPIMSTMQENPNPRDSQHLGPGVIYVDPDERNDVGYPVRDEPVPWTAPPTEANLYQELMAPHTELFGAAQLWWDHPSHAGAPFVRGLPPKHGEDHRFLRVNEAHEKFPMQDGPRGIGWMSPYVTGAVDSQGRFAFAETGGRIGYLMPDGEIITIAGWRVQPDLNPVWWEKPLATVRNNMENRGIWTAGRGEFHTPLDVAIDPQNENVLYVAAYEDHVIWRVEVPADPRTQEATISILAGDPNHQPGFADDQGDAARFDGPASLVFDPVADVLYVADQDNDAIRRVDREGIVTTVAGEPGMQDRLTATGVDWLDQLAARAATQFEVSPEQAANGTTPDIFRPQSIRVDSQGNIVLLELGYGAIRQIDPATGATSTLGEVRQRQSQWTRGWAWLDVDRWGNSGPKDGIYWTKFVQTLEGEHFSEVYEWIPPGGGESVQVFGFPTGLYPDGWGRLSATNAPHYGWLVAVDPRGGVLLAGAGEHGLTRLRPQRGDDPIEDREDYWLGRKAWAAGAPWQAPVASQSTALKYGWGGHNYLGLTDAWALEGASDQELLDAFEIPASVRADATALRQVLAFLRPNTFGAEGSFAPPPPPTATATVAPTATPVPTVAPTSTPVPTATPVPTVAPTATPVPTVAPTSTVAPTVTPTSNRYPNPRRRRSAAIS